MAPSLAPDAATAVEASPEPVCVRVDPATLPKGVAKFENAVSALEADVATLEERATADAASKKKSAAILQDLTLAGEDFAGAVRQIKFDRKIGKAVAKVTGSVSGDALGAQFAYSGSKLDPLPEILSHLGGHAAIDVFRSAVGYEWPCEAAATETDTMPEPGAEAVAEGFPADTVEEEGHAAADPTVGVRQRPAGLPLRRPAVAGCERRPNPAAAKCGDHGDRTGAAVGCRERRRLEQGRGRITITDGLLHPLRPERRALT